jgi:hypothetical protein
MNMKHIEAKLVDCVNCEKKTFTGWILKGMQATFSQQDYHMEGKHVQ